MKDFINFIKKYKIQLILSFFIILIIYFYYFNNIISIDTEIYINNPNEILKSWIAIDRWSLVLLKNIILKIPFYIPIIRIFTILLFYISTIIYTYIFTNWIKKDNKILVFLILISLSTSPIFAEQFSFTLQSLEMALGMFLFSINLISIDYYITKHKKIYLFYSIVLTTFCFGLYQSFILLFISSCIFYVLTHDYKSLYKFILIFFISYILCFLIGYFLKHNIYHTNSSYLTNNFKWTEDDILHNILKIGYFGITTLLGISYFHNISFTLFFIIGMFYLLKYKKLNNLFFFLCLSLSPFILIILTANNQAYRSQFSYVFVTIFLFLYLLKYKKLKNILICIISIFIIKNILITPMLFYSDYNRYQNDLKLAKYVEKVSKKNPNKNIVFIGSYNSSTKIKGETLGNSFASWNEGVMGVNNRMYGFLRTQNINISLPTKEQYIESLSIPNNYYYPNSKGIKKYKDLVIIYLR